MKRAVRDAATASALTSLEVLSIGMRGGARPVAIRPPDQEDCDGIKQLPATA